VLQCVLVVLGGAFALFLPLEELQSHWQLDQKSSFTGSGAEDIVIKQKQARDKSENVED